MLSFSVESSIVNPYVVCTGHTPQKVFLQTRIDCSCSAVGKAKERINPESPAYCRTLTKLVTPNVTNNGITAANSLIKGFSSRSHLLVRFLLYILSEENRVDVVDNWLDVQSVIQTHVYSRKQENVVGENSKRSRVAWLRE